MSEERIERLEQLVADLDTRIALVEQRACADAPDLAPSAPRPVRAPRRVAPAAGPAAARPRALAGWSPRVVGIPTDREELEDLLGGRVLAWVGGLAVLLGLVFLYALAVSHGWIGEAGRTALGAAGSAGLLALGVWLHERKARTDAALAAVATGISGLFVTVTVAAQVYSLVPQLLAVVLAIGVGAIGTALAVRWESRGIAALGTLGALAAPVLAGAGAEGGTMVLLFVALASTAGVLLWQRWNWLALAAFAVATPQWGSYVVNGASVLEEIAVLVAFGGLGVAVSVGHDVRVRAERLRSASAYLLSLNAIVVAATGWAALGWMQNPDAGNAWLAGVAIVHIGVGLAGPRVSRISRDLALLSLVLGAVIADAAFGLIADGPVLAIGWAATGAGFAALVRRGARSGTDGLAPDLLAQAGLGGHLVLSLLSAVAASDPVQVFAGHESLSLAGGAAVAALAAGCLVSGRIAGERDAFWKVVLDSAGIACVAVLTAMSLEGLQLVLAWGAEAVALAATARRTGDEAAAWGAAGFLSLAGLHALVYEAPPVSLVTGLAEPAAAVTALATVAAGALLLAAWTPPRLTELAAPLKALAALALLYLGSGGVVTPFESSAAVDSALLSAHQQGQMVLSVFWALVGVGTMVAGLRRDRRIARVAGLALVGVAVAKVFVIDLATLTSVYRVVSFIGLGVLLLAGGFVWQRLRPQLLTDLRETPAGVR